MPGCKGHLVGGAIAYGAALAIVSTMTQPTLATTIEWGALTLAGSLFPDVDTNSHGQKLFARVGLIACIMMLMRGNIKMVAYLSVLLCLPMIVKHRGIFHRIWFVIGVPALVVYLSSIHMPKQTMAIFFDAVFFCAGAISHLWLDYGFKRMLRL